MVAGGGRDSCGELLRAGGRLPQPSVGLPRGPVGI